MIQSVLFFVLGFLVAAALALAVAPALWRRAGALTRKRIEATMPLSREELQAQVDAVQAEHAMAMRRLEMKAEAIKKKAAQDLVEINLLREEVRSLEEERDGRDAALAELQAERDELVARLAAAEGESKALAARFRKAETRLDERTQEVEEISRLYEETSLTASSRQVELVARETEIDHLNETLGILRNQRKEADRAMREAITEKTQAEHALQTERRRVAELQQKVERLMTNLSTRDDRLERQGAEIARLKQKLRESEAARRSGREGGSERETARLEAQVADLSQQLSSLLAGGEKAREGGSPAPSKPEMERLRSRLATLLRENRKLRAELAASAEAGEESGDELLRERIANLAAEVVNMAATLQGPDSPIEKALAEESRAPDGGSHPPTLADRVRALKEGAAAEQGTDGEPMEAAHRK